MQRFSFGWTVVSIALFCAVELFLGGFVGPMLVGRFVSQPLYIKLQMLLMLGSYYVGGVLVGMFSPRVRLWEPAVGAFVSVAIVLMYGLFLPNTWLRFDGTKMILGGGIAFVLALAGAYTGEKWMGNVGDDPTTARGRLRQRMWREDGLLAGGRDDWLAPSDRTRIR